MSTELRIILGVLIVAICIGLFIFTYILNKRTPKPEGCEHIGEECEGCQMTSCSHHLSHNKKEEKEEGEIK